MDSLSIEVKQLSKYYHSSAEKVVALSSVNLSIATGAKVAIMGPSGSGKSTLLQMIGGLDRPSEGQITVSGQQISNLNDRDLSTYRNQSVGFIFQSFNLHSYHTALENVCLPLVVRGSSLRQAADPAQSLLQQMGLADKQNKYPAQLSGGEMQRVAIARALIGQPKVLLADEPTANLDADNAQSILSLLLSLELKDQTLIVVTHDPRIAQQFDYTIQLDKGRIV